jgi:hypothetical protein
MSRAKFIVRSIVIAVALCVTLSSVSLAQDKGPKDLNSYLCKDIMRLSGEHRSIAIAFLHGYLLGKKGTTAFDTQKMAEATDQFIEYALDNPTAKALDGMSKFIE